MLNTLKALADTSRLRLVAVLSHGEFTVQELTSILVMGQSRISRHLKILTRIGILSVKRQGTWGYYRLAGSNSFFREIWPGLERRLDTLAGRQADLERSFPLLSIWIFSLKKFQRVMWCLKWGWALAACLPASAGKPHVWWRWIILRL